MTPSSPSGSMSPKSQISGYKMRQLPNFTPEQMQLFQKKIQALTSGGGLEGGYDYLNRLASGDESLFAEMEKPAYAALERGLGQTANRFSQFGAQDSSAFQNALAGQSADVAMNLQAQRGDLRRQAIDALMGDSEKLLSQRPHENVLEKKPEKFDWAGLAAQLLPILLSAAGPGGAFAGAGVNAASQAALAARRSQGGVGGGG